MKGEYDFEVSNNRIKYTFKIRRNITVIQGKSGTGKTTLIEMLSTYEQLKDSSGISVNANVEFSVGVNTGIPLEVYLQYNENKVIFFDEECEYVRSIEFAKIIQKLGCYVVIVNRSPIKTLPYSAQEVYELRESKQYGGLQQVVNVWNPIYGNELSNTKLDNIVNMVTEDKKSGYTFFHKICEKSKIVCISANGNGSIIQLMREREEPTLFIVDGAAFGAYIQECIEYLLISQKKHVLWFPESFEYLILKSGLISIADIKKILENASSYIESKEYFSWERFFTALLENNTRGTQKEYSKANLNSYYMTDKSIKKILDEFDPNIQKLFQ